MAEAIETLAARLQQGQNEANARLAEAMAAMTRMQATIQEQQSAPVSYTHLTLPTICSV